MTCVLMFTLRLFSSPATFDPAMVELFSALGSGGEFCVVLQSLLNSKYKYMYCL